MKKWFLFLSIVLLAISGLANTASADDSNVQTATQWCSGLISSTAIISPLVQCFTDTTQGIIPTVTLSFLNHGKTDYLPVVGVIFLLVIVYHGIRMFLGDVQRIKSDTVLLGLKMAGVMLFLSSAPAIYINMVSILQQLSQNISSAATSLHTSGFCVGSTTSSLTSLGSSDNSQWQWDSGGLWARWDCIFQYLLGFSTAGFAAASIASFLLLMFYSMGTGLLVMFMALGLIYSLLSAVFRFIHVYLMATLALSFMFCIGYLFVPLLLFRNTFEYFRKWLSMVFGYILTPVIMFAFMGMMLMAADITLFSGQYSVFCKIGGPSTCGTNTAGGSTLFSNMTANLNPNSNNNMESYMKQLFQIGINGPASLMNTSSAVLAVDQATGVGAGTGCVGNGVEGAAGVLCNTGETGDDASNTTNTGVAKSGVPTNRLNLETLASNAGSSCQKTDLGNSPNSVALQSALNGSLNSGQPIDYYYSNCPWIQDILISLCVAALVIYIMLSLLTYIPSLASNLSSSLIQGNLASTGGNMLQSGLNTAKGQAQNMAQGKPDGGIVGRSMEALSSMVGNRDL